MTPVGDHPVDGSELGVVVLAKAELVSDLVDAVVVGVHEGFACSDRSPDLDRQRRQGPPSVLTTTGLMGPGKAGGRKRSVLHYDRALTTKRRMRLKLLGNDALSCIPVLGPPRQNIHHVVVDGNAIADHAVFTGRKPGGDRGERCTGGRRCDGRDRASGQPGEGRSKVGPGLELVPAETVDDQEYDCRRIEHLIVEERRPARLRFQQVRHDLGDTAVIPVGKHGRGAHRG